MREFSSPVHLVSPTLIFVAMGMSSKTAMSPANIRGKCVSGLGYPDGMVHEVSSPLQPVSSMSMFVALGVCWKTAMSPAGADVRNMRKQPSLPEKKDSSRPLVKLEK